MESFIPISKDSIAMLLETTYRNATYSCLSGVYLTSIVEDQLQQINASYLELVDIMNCGLTLQAHERTCFFECPSDEQIFLSTSRRSSSSISRDRSQRPASAGQCKLFRACRSHDCGLMLQAHGTASFVQED